MTAFKRCCGHKGHWECADDYPDHMVPVDEFATYKSSEDGRQPMCRRCRVDMDAIRWKKRLRHPLTGEVKSDWKQRIARSYGGSQGTPEWKSYLERAEIQWNEEWKAHLLNTERNGEVVLAHIKRSEFGQSKPMTKRMSTEVEGEKVPEGWVYVVRNPDFPHILKIGKTFPDGIASIMSDARRFGRAELLHKCWFWKAHKSEQSIHRVLKKYNLRALGYTDCGKELFECSIDIAMSAILSECGDTEDAA